MYPHDYITVTNVYYRAVINTHSIVHKILSNDHLDPPDKAEAYHTGNSSQYIKQTDVITVGELDTPVT